MTSIEAMLVHTLIFPIIDDGDLYYSDLKPDSLNKYEQLLDNCIRFVYNRRKYDHISSYRAELKCLSIRQRK